MRVERSSFQKLAEYRETSQTVYLLEMIWISQGNKGIPSLSLILLIFKSNYCMTTRDLFSELSAPSKPDISQEIASLCRVLQEHIWASAPAKYNNENNYCHCCLFIYYDRNTSNCKVWHSTFMSPQCSLQWPLIHQLMHLCRNGRLLPASLWATWGSASCPRARQTYGQSWDSDRRPFVHWMTNTSIEPQTPNS